MPQLHKAVDVSGYFKRTRLFRKKPYNFLLLTAAIIAIVGQLWLGNSTMDIHIHDTYFVFPATVYVWFPTICLLVFWLFYILTNKFLYSNRLTKAHIIFTILISLFISVSPLVSTNSYQALAGIPRRYLDNGQWNELKVFRMLTKLGVIVLLILTFGQLTYLLNLTVGLYQYFRSKNNR